MAISDLLRGCPLFFELYEPEVEKIVKNCTVLQFKKGDAIIKEGNVGTEIFVVLDGTASIQKTGKSGRVRIQDLQPGDVFGEMVLVDETTRTADVIAESVSSVLEIRYKDIFDLYQSEPKIFGLMILNLSRLLARRLRSSNQLITKLLETIEKLQGN